MSTDNRSLMLLAALAADRRLPGGSKLLIWIAAQVALWVHNVKTRRELALMDPHLLNDIGMTELEARRELVKPFWHR